MCRIGRDDAKNNDFKSSEPIGAKGIQGCLRATPLPSGKSVQKVERSNTFTPQYDHGVCMRYHLFLYVPVPTVPAAECTQGIHVGWNIGNAFEAVDTARRTYIPCETAWGASGNSSNKAPRNPDESHIDARHTEMKSSFVNKGVPVILGEYAAMLRNTSDRPASRLAWDKYIIVAAVKAGMIPFCRDPGVLSTNSSGRFDRNTGRQGYPAVIAGIAAAPPVSTRHKKRQDFPMHTAHSATFHSSGMFLYCLNSRRRGGSSQPLPLSSPGGIPYRHRFGISLHGYTSDTLNSVRKGYIYYE